MNRDQFRDLVEFGRIREEKVSAWLRHILLMAAGVFSVLVGLSGQLPEPGPSRLLWKLALAAIGFGILLGSLSLYAEVWTARDHARQLARRAQQEPSCPNDEWILPIVSKLPWPLKAAEPAAYLCLGSAVLLLVGHALTR